MIKNEDVLDFSNTCHRVTVADIPADWITEFESRLIPAEHSKWDGMSEVDKVWFILYDLNYRNSVIEAKRLGYNEHPEIKLLHDPYALVGFATGREAGIKLAQEWDFYGPAKAEWTDDFSPRYMWDEVAYRRYGDAVVLFIGDDRGYAQHWTYYVCVKWEPEEVQGWLESRGRIYHK